MRRRQMMQKVSRISLCVVIGLLFLALIWKFAGAQLAKKGIVLSNDTAAKTVSETAPEAEDGSGNAGIKKLAETTPPNETPGWQYSSSGWWYATDATTYYVNGWADIDGNQYHFDSNGYMATGWKAIGGKGCYFDDQGVYQPDRNGSMMVALTFDDGPSKTTPAVLDALNAAGVKATFFVVATGYNEKYLPLIADAAAAGHQIALHSASHEYSDIYQSSAAYWQDITLLKKRISPYVNTASLHYLRFPGGSTNTVSHRYGGRQIMQQLKAQAEQKGYAWIDWNVCAEDATASHPNAAQILRNVQNDAKDQPICVVLMHDTNATHETVKALPDILEWFAAKGYRFFTVQQMAE